LYFEAYFNVEKLRDLQHANGHDTLKTRRVPPDDKPTERSTPRSWRSTQKAAAKVAWLSFPEAEGRGESGGGGVGGGLETHPAEATLGVAAAQYAQQLHEDQGNVHRACSRE